MCSSSNNIIDKTLNNTFISCNHGEMMQFLMDILHKSGVSHLSIRWVSVYLFLSSRYCQWCAFNVICNPDTLSVLLIERVNGWYFADLLYYIGFVRLGTDFPCYQNCNAQEHSYLVHVLNPAVAYIWRLFCYSLHQVQLESALVNFNFDFTQNLSPNYNTEVLWGESVVFNI